MFVTPVRSERSLLWIPAILIVISILSYLFPNYGSISIRDFGVSDGSETAAENRDIASISNRIESAMADIRREIELARSETLNFSDVSREAFLKKLEELERSLGKKTGSSASTSSKPERVKATKYKCIGQPDASEMCDYEYACINFPSYGTRHYSGLYDMSLLYNDNVGIYTNKYNLTDESLSYSEEELEDIERVTIHNSKQTPYQHIYGPQADHHHYMYAWDFEDLDQPHPPAVRPRLFPFNSDFVVHARKASTAIPYIFGGNFPGMVTWLDDMYLTYTHLEGNIWSQAVNVLIPLLLTPLINISQHHNFPPIHHVVRAPARAIMDRAVNMHMRCGYYSSFYLENYTSHTHYCGRLKGDTWILGAMEFMKKSVSYPRLNLHEDLLAARPPGHEYVPYDNYKNGDRVKFRDFGKTLIEAFGPVVDYCINLKGNLDDSTMYADHEFDIHDRDYEPIVGMKNPLEQFGNIFTSLYNQTLVYNLTNSVYPMSSVLETPLLRAARCVLAAMAGRIKLPLDVRKAMTEDSVLKMLTREPVNPGRSVEILHTMADLQERHVMVEGVIAVLKYRFSTGAKLYQGLSDDQVESVRRGFTPVNSQLPASFSLSEGHGSGRSFGLEDFLNAEFMPHVAETVFNISMELPHHLCGRRTIALGAKDMTYSGFADYMYALREAVANVGVDRNALGRYLNDPDKVLIVDRGRAPIDPHAKEPLPYGRWMHNAEQVVDVVKKYNVTYRYLLDSELMKLDFNGQVSLFSQYNVIIAVHGATMMNLLFLPRRSAIIEIYPYGMWCPLYQRMLSNAGHFVFPIYSPLKGPNMSFNYSFGWHTEESRAKNRKMYLECERLSHVQSSTRPDCWMEYKASAAYVPIHTFEETFLTAMGSVGTKMLHRNSPISLLHGIPTTSEPLPYNAHTDLEFYANQVKSLTFKDGNGTDINLAPFGVPPGWERVTDPQKK